MLTESCFSRRYPDPNPVHPPDLPETPLYPTLHTTVPVPAMSYPGSPYPPGTPLYPPHTHVLEYLRNITRRCGLEPYIRRGHEVLSASWVGNFTAGYWNTSVRIGGQRTKVMTFDHIVGAVGNFHYPYTPEWPGQGEWSGKIMHSIYYRGPDEFSGKRVLVVGSGASGRDAVLQLEPTAAKVYMCIRGANPRASDGVPQGTHVVPGISRFSMHGVHFVDGSSAEVDVVFLATGYTMQVPFLTSGGALDIDRAGRAWTGGSSLTNNLRYIYPLHEHVLSLDPAYPPGALAFAGLTQMINAAPAAYAQAMFITSVYRNASILPSREQMLDACRRREQALRGGGWDPYAVGHRLVDGSQHDYQDRLVAFLKGVGAMPNDGKTYVDRWRRDNSELQYLRRGWQRIETLKIEAEWLKGIETEEQWAEMMQRMNDWQRDYEVENGIPFAPGVAQP
ncbi:FAD/NAD(P)-binding domain-containing protein [Auricularia subglabra TFB-10046 SS5]|nr:FAD/NAD(P)-binding domain-containing protein [Auricularia subglabra TFB-10046 SS5]